MLCKVCSGGTQTHESDFNAVVIACLTGREEVRSLHLALVCLMMNIDSFATLCESVLQRLFGVLKTKRDDFILVLFFAFILSINQEQCPFCFFSHLALNFYYVSWDQHVTPASFFLLRYLGRQSMADAMSYPCTWCRNSAQMTCCSG